MVRCTVLRIDNIICSFHGIGWFDKHFSTIIIFIIIIIVIVIIIIIIIIYIW